VNYTILLIGGGGREHAIAKAITDSPRCEKLYVAPGNAGTKSLAFNVTLDTSNFDTVAQFCESYHVDWIVVGPEQPLVEGIYDYFTNHKVKVIGPSKVAAMLEGSKSFAKAFMKKMNIPTAGYKAFTQETLQDGVNLLKSHPTPIVLKADGLAAGKGVLILEDRDEAIREFKDMLSGKFGEASQTVVVEEFLSGIEFSVFVATDGKEYVILPEAKDYKRIGEQDKGLNTGGMGAVSPVPFYDDIMKAKVIEQVIEPTIAGIQQEELDYTGFIFLGLISVEGDPYVIEYNCRMGDPETEVVFPRIKSDVVSLFEAMVDNTLNQYTLETKPETAVTVFSVSGGYPGAYEKGKKMHIPTNSDQCYYYHAGTKAIDNSVVTNGGRVIAATALADDLNSAIQQAQEGAKALSFEGQYYRTDIGKDLLPYL
jgi:phosphoribosylamine--glycine ligase